MANPIDLVCDAHNVEGCAECFPASPLVAVQPAEPVLPGFPVPPAAPTEHIWEFDRAIAAPLMAHLERFCIHVTETRPANQNIGRNDNPYIDRWMLARKGQVPVYDDPQMWGVAGFMPAELENLYLHAYHRGDADEPHDHPWGNASLVVRGYYREAVFTDGRLVGHFTRKPGDVVLRRATSVHAIIDTSPDCLSLFATLPKERNWGFHTADGFVRWQDFGKSNGRRRA